MTDQEPNKYNPKFRRRKKHQGSVWTPRNSPALLPDGAWCRWCKTRHGYMTMGIKFEKRSRKHWEHTGGQHYSITRSFFVILWICRKTGFVIEEMELGKDGRRQGEST